MYLKENKIKALLNRIKEKVGSYTLIFDAFSVLTAKSAANHPSLKKTGAKIVWGLDDPMELTKWGNKISFIDEKYYTSNEAIHNLNSITRFMFKIAGLFPAARKAHRILIYKVG